MYPRGFLNSLPIALGGIALSFASLGSLAEGVPAAKATCGTVAVALLALLAARCVRHPDLLRQDLSHRINAGVAGTVPMALFVLSDYLFPASYAAAFGLWIVAFACSVFLAGNFFVRFIVRESWRELTPASFVPLIGPLLCAMTGAAFPVAGLLDVVFRVILVVTFVLMPVVAVRYATNAPTVESLRPLLCIFAAPPSMCLANWLALGARPGMAELAGVWAVCLALWVFGFAVALRCVRMPFQPSFSAMTFPFVISASATRLVAACLPAGLAAQTVAAMGWLQLVVAVGLTCYVTVRFVAFVMRQRA
jgi:exfoliative toxin A/B